MEYLEIIGFAREYAVLKNEAGEFFILEADENQAPLGTVLEKTEDCISLENVLILLGFSENEE